VGMTLTQVLERLSKVSWLQTLTLSGTGRPSQLLSLSGKMQTLGHPKQVTVGGRIRQVSAIKLVN
jgi:hypothetical protein